MRAAAKNSAYSSVPKMSVWFPSWWIRIFFIFLMRLPIGVCVGVLPEGGVCFSDFAAKLTKNTDNLLALYFFFNYWVSFLLVERDLAAFRRLS